MVWMDSKSYIAIHENDATIRQLFRWATPTILIYRVQASGSGPAFAAAHGNNLPDSRISMETIMVTSFLDFSQC